MKACDECVLFNTDACPMGCAFRDKPCEDFLSVESEVRNYVDDIE